MSVAVLTFSQQKGSHILPLSCLNAEDLETERCLGTASKAVVCPTTAATPARLAGFHSDSPEYSQVILTEYVLAVEPFDRRLRWHDLITTTTLALAITCILAYFYEKYYSKR